MKRLNPAIGCIAFCVLAVTPRAAERQPIVVVRGPTIVAFFEPVPQAKLDKDPDTNEALRISNCMQQMSASRSGRRASNFMNYTRTLFNYAMERDLPRFVRLK
jgi:hypothetical protein